MTERLHFYQKEPKTAKIGATPKFQWETPSVESKHCNAVIWKILKVESHIEKSQRTPFRKIFAFVRETLV